MPPPLSFPISLMPFFLSLFSCRYFSLYFSFVIIIDIFFAIC